MLETLNYTIHIGSTPTFLYFELWLKLVELETGNDLVLILKLWTHLKEELL